MYAMGMMQWTFLCVHCSYYVLSFGWYVLRTGNVQAENWCLLQMAFEKWRMRRAWWKEDFFPSVFVRKCSKIFHVNLIWKCIWKRIVKCIYFYQYDMVIFGQLKQWQINGTVVVCCNYLILVHLLFSHEGKAVPSLLPFVSGPQQQLSEIAVFLTGELMLIGRLRWELLVFETY